MERFLTELLYMSLTASYLVAIVLILRLLLAKAPKWIRVILWGMVGIRLLFPLRIESVFSLVPRAMTPQENIVSGTSVDAMYQTSEGITPVLPELDAGAGFVSSGTEIIQQTSPGIPWVPILLAVWAAGVVSMLVYCVISYVRLSVRMREAVKYTEKGIYQSEKVDSPFVLGILKPRIYLPFALDEKELECVIAHEKAHIARKDHFIKPFAFLLLAMHWFNPFIWIAYILLCRDIELACDEKAIRVLGEAQKKVYSQALLKCSVSRRSIAACPVAFGETGVKARIKNVLHYKKPAFWIVTMSLLVCLVVAVCFLTNPRQEVAKEPSTEESLNEVVEGNQSESMQEDMSGQEEAEQSAQSAVMEDPVVPPTMHLKNAYSSSMDFFAVEAGTHSWNVMRAKSGTKSWEAIGGENAVMVSSEGQGLYPTAAVKGKEWIILSDDIGSPYMMDFSTGTNVNGLESYVEEPDSITVREYDLLDLADEYAEPVSEVTWDENTPLILYPRRIYEVVAEWNLGQYSYRGFYGSASYCFATSDVLADSSEAEDTVVFEAVIKEMMVDTKDRICISSKSDDYPGAFVLIVPETIMDKNNLSADGLYRITARETGETQSNMKVLEATEIRLHPIGNSPGGIFEPALGSKVEYEVNTLPDVKLSMDKYKSWEGEVTFRSSAEKSYTYGDWYEIHYKFGEEWHRVPYLNALGYYDLAYALPAGESVSLMINWKSIYGELPAGTYRIVKDVIDYRSPGDYDKHYQAAEFEIMPSDG